MGCQLMTSSQRGRGRYALCVVLSVTLQLVSGQSSNSSNPPPQSFNGAGFPSAHVNPPNHPPQLDGCNFPSRFPTSFSVLSACRQYGHRMHP